MTYSQPTRSCRLNSDLPKPTEKRSTLTPSFRATQKCPNSCTVTSTTMATTNEPSDHNTAKSCCITGLTILESNTRFDLLLCALARFTIDSSQSQKISRHQTICHSLQHAFNHIGNTGKRQASR